MDTSSIDPTTDSGIDTENDEDDIPVAVPVESVLANSNRSDVDEDDIDSDDEIMNEASTSVGGKQDGGGLDTTFDTADGDDDEETGSLGTDITPPPPSAVTSAESTSGKKRSSSEVSDPAAAPSSKKKKKSNERNRDAPPLRRACQGLTIPFRTIKRIMKLDTTIGIVQNDAAIVTTAALEHFVKEFAVKSLELAKKKGRNTIKYDDVAEVRAADRSLNFLDLLIP